MLRRKNVTGFIDQNADSVGAVFISATFTSFPFLLCAWREFLSEVCGQFISILLWNGGQCVGDVIHDTTDFDEANDLQQSWQAAQVNQARMRIHHLQIELISHQDLGSLRATGVS